MGLCSVTAGEQTVVGNRPLFAELGIALPEAAPAMEGTEVYVGRGGRYLASILISDRLRPGAASAVQALQAMSIDVVLLTGDTGQTAQSVAGRLGIREVHAELLPEQKTRLIGEQVRAGRVIAMLGDGINDAPALAEATVGVAMGAGTDVARESADVVLIGNDLEKFVETVRVARNCRRIILEIFTEHSSSIPLESAWRRRDT